MTGTLSFRRSPPPAARAVRRRRPQPAELSPQPFGVRQPIDADVQKAADAPLRRRTGRGRGRPSGRSKRITARTPPAIRPGEAGQDLVDDVIDRAAVDVDRDRRALAIERLAEGQQSLRSRGGRPKAVRSGRRSLVAASAATWRSIVSTVARSQTAGPAARIRRGFGVQHGPASRGDHQPRTRQTCARNSANTSRSRARKAGSPSSAKISPDRSGRPGARFPHRHRPPRSRAARPAAWRRSSFPSPDIRSASRP